MIRNISILFLAGFFFLASCKKDLLDKKNPATISSDDVWKDAGLIGLYVNNLYTYIPGWDYNTYNNISDEARSNYPGGPNSILIGEWNETNNPLDNWNQSYQQIRVANDFFLNIETSPVGNDVKSKFIAEVKFLRALFYFNLVKRYGGVPLITTAQKLNDDLMVSRNTADECFNFITAELDAALPNLPLNADRGRITKGAAMALKTRTLLYQASPLFNASNDTERWRKAAQAAKAVIDLGKYDLFPDLKTLWLDKSATNVEIILEKQYHLPETSHGWDAMVKPVWLAKGDAGQCSPVQELVNAFPMKNGKLINEPGSGYDQTKPYTGRDDRFYSFIAYNQSKVSGILARPYPGAQPGQLYKEYALNVYKGGTDYDSIPPYAQYNTITGYYTVKATNPDNAVYSYGYGSEQPWIEFRYAEILLDYAEASNEADGPSASIYDALDKIRARGGIASKLVQNLSQTQMRNLIRNERYIELCFEGQRYWDLRRWKIADQVLNGKKLTGVVITKQAPNTFTYEYFPIDPQPLVFDASKMYLMPIPKAELSKNPKLTQNPNWPK